MRTLWPRALAIWLLFMVVAILNGALREGVLLPLLGRSVALPLSGVLLSLLILLITLAVFPFLRPGTVRACWSVGVFWLVLTVGFEWSFGLARGESWGTLIGMYNIFSGNFWILVPLATLVAPRLAGALRRRSV